MMHRYAKSMIAALVGILAVCGNALAAAGIPVICPNCDLRGHVPANVDYTQANWRGAKLAGVNLNGRNLAGAVLAGADLSDAKLHGAILTGADLSGANLAGADLSGATLKSVDLSYAALEGADFSGTDLSTARLGPHPKTGIRKGKKTSFDQAIVHDGTALDQATAETGQMRTVAGTADGMSSVGGLNCPAALPPETKSLAYVDTTGSDGEHCGDSETNACKTIARGIGACSGKQGCTVLIGFGSYPQATPLAVRDGIGLQGGCVPKNYSPVGLMSLIEAPEGGKPAVIAVGIGNATIVRGFKINATPATAPGAPSIAVQVENSPGLQFIDARIYAAAGGPGAAGTVTGEAIAGPDAKANIGGKNTCSGVNVDGGDGGGTMSVKTELTGDGQAHCQGCNPIVFQNNTIYCNGNCNGADGRPGSDPAVAKGGEHGEPNLGSCAYYRGGAGKPGHAANAGNCGAAGQPSANLKGEFRNGQWNALSGGAGGEGGAGGGGGGGGSGGATGGFCVVVIREYKSGPGGGGGAGGCGGPAGTGGQQGGASFAVVNLGGALAMVDTVIIGNRSGNGGEGRAGKAGARGGAPGQPGDTNSGRGEAGGKGGSGGASGGGAGGNSGPSIGVALLKDARLLPGSLAIIDGAAGDVGRGGASAGNCKAQGGAGKAGEVAKTAQFP